MNKTLIAATALLVFGAPIAFAANNANTLRPAVGGEQIAAMTPSEHCTALEEQFTREEANHKSAKELAQAQTLYQDGMALCKAHKHQEGMRKIQDGLKLMGVTPVKG